ncbi:MAG TPA: SDR family oxidoreductase [Pseudomonadota bacterium]|nr:SDR family oxidoreductase [Pseudomonadota bacterium]
MSLANKSVLITGASRGLGRALSLLLAGAGARVVMVARHKEPLDAAVAEVTAAGGTAFGLVADLGDKHQIHAIAGEAAALVGPLDIVIHNASILGPTPLQLLLDTECEDFERVLQANLLGPFRLTKILAGAMALRGGGQIVHISSDAGVSAYPRWGSYGVSKAALDHLSRSWAAELDGTGVRVFAVDPGEMDTVMHAAAMPEADPKTLTPPAVIAARIVDMLRHPPAGGARVSAPDWQLGKEGTP